MRAQNEWSDRQCLECSYASSQDHEVKMSGAQKGMQDTWEANGEEEGRQLINLAEKLVKKGSKEHDREAANLKSRGKQLQANGKKKNKHW